MSKILYPPYFHQRVLAQEAPGADPATISLVVPTIIVPGEPFNLKIAILDENGYPSMQCDGSLVVWNPSVSPEIEVTFTKDQPAIAFVNDLVISSEGIFRFEAEFNGKIFHSNPIVCTNTPDHRIYWGDPHVHTILSSCHADKCRSLNFCYTAAKYLIGLDWVAAADHVSNGRCNFAKWKEQSAACNAYNDLPEFATLPAYEASLKGGAGGDNNVYLSQHLDIFVDEYDEGNVKTLCKKLVGTNVDFFVVPHHTTRTGKHGEISDEIYPGADLMPVIEIHSKWGTSEYRGNPNPLKKIHTGPSYTVDLLNRGLKLGFIAGTDTHTTMPSGLGIEPGHIDRLPGLTAIFANELSRNAIFKAIKNRNCYATSLERIYLDVTITGIRLSKNIDWHSKDCRKIEVTAAAKSRITSIEIVRNGVVIHKDLIDSWKTSLIYTDEDKLDEVCLNSRYLGKFVYYYVRVTCSSGAQAWSSPMWLQMM